MASAHFDFHIARHEANRPDPSPEGASLYDAMHALCTIGSVEQDGRPPKKQKTNKLGKAATVIDTPPANIPCVADYTFYMVRLLISTVSTI